MAAFDHISGVTSTVACKEKHGTQEIQVAQHDQMHTVRKNILTVATAARLHHNAREVAMCVVRPPKRIPCTFLSLAHAEKMTGQHLLLAV